MVLLSVSCYLSSSWYEERLWDEWRQHRLREGFQTGCMWSHTGGQLGDHQSTLERREDPVSFSTSDWWNSTQLQTGLGAWRDVHGSTGQHCLLAAGFALPEPWAKPRGTLTSTDKNLGAISQRRQHLISSNTPLVQVHKNQPRQEKPSSKLTISGPVYQSYDLGVWLGSGQFWFSWGQSCLNKAKTPQNAHIALRCLFFSCSLFSSSHGWHEHQCSSRWAPQCHALPRCQRGCVRLRAAK